MNCHPIQEAIDNTLAQLRSRDLVVGGRAANSRQRQPVW